MEYKPSTDKDLTGEWLGLELRKDFPAISAKPSDPVAPHAPAGPTN